MWETTGLNNESDVEQKFIYPLLTENAPIGLSIPPAVVQTKVNIRRLSIGKGADQKLYFPDYLIVDMGFPLVVVEAKHPSESVEEGYRQARLYAAELNALYAHGLSPAKYVIASNGVELWFGYSDHVEPVQRVRCETLGIYSPEIAEFISLLSWKQLSTYAYTLAKSQRPADLFKTRRLLGGGGIQNEEVAINSFGATVTATISNIFNPQSLEDRVNIVKNGYIPSLRRQRYIDPIDRIIRAAKPPCEIDAKRLENSSKPSEIIDKLKTSKSLEHKVLLVIGSVGSGKTTFIDYLQEVALPKDIVNSSVWCRLNMNTAPVSADEIYSWLRNEIIESCRKSLPNLDFDDLDIIRKLYGVEISKFAKGVGKLYQEDTITYNNKLGEYIEGLQRDTHLVATAHVRFCCGEREKLCLIVLDNCDKKTRDEQLLMFEAAQWLQKEFRCLVILPLRDETYDNHRDQPPLDTVLKDMVFRIEPPLFQSVLMSRVQLALQAMSSSSSEKLSFSLPNGFHVDYPKSEQAFYLTSIIKSLFEHDRFARRMIVGLAGRNMRKALEIFLEFCSSGYIGDDQIFKIIQSEGNHVLPFHQVATVILRMNRRYYDSDHSYIKNVFAATQDDASPSFFCRYMILKWLRNRFKKTGAASLPGYFPKREVKHSLVPYGLSPEVLDREFNYLLAGQCIIAEHLRVDYCSDDDLVRLGPAGFVHLDLIGNVNYLAAIAEDTFFEDRLQAERIANRIRTPSSQLNVRTTVFNANEVVSYLEIVKARLTPPNGSFMTDDLLDEISDFSEAKDALARVSKSYTSDPWFDADKRLRRGSTHHVVVTTSVAYGCFVEFDDGLFGLIHNSKFKGLNPSVGDRVEVKIEWVDVIQKKMGLLLVEILEEDAGDKVLGTY